MQIGLNLVWRNMGALLLCVLAMLAQPTWAGDLRVLLILSDGTQPYQSFAQKLKDSLPNSIHLAVQQVERTRIADPADLVITVGMKAAEVAMPSPGAPMMVVMVPKGGYDNLLVGQAMPQGISAIYLDQPWARQFDFLHALIPDLSQVGLVYSPENQLDVSHLFITAKNHGSKVSSQVVRSADGLFASLEKVLSGSDVLLAIPDSRIYNASNIRNILLTSYRHKVPLIGFSPGYVNAGALAAIFTRPEQIAEQTANKIVEFSQKRTLPTPQYPDDFDISVNLQVARSLGITPPSEEVIRKRMRNAGEGGR